MKTVSILYGFAEGPFQGKDIISEFQKLGYKIISQAAEADIIFAHSGGCNMVPKNNKAKIIVLVGVPWWPHKSLLTRLFQKVRQDYKAHSNIGQARWWMVKLFFNSLYTIAQPLKNARMATQYLQMNLPSSKTGQAIILVRNSADTLSSPDIHKSNSSVSSFRYVELLGVHDDCWINPKPYVELIKQ